MTINLLEHDRRSIFRRPCARCIASIREKQRADLGGHALRSPSLLHAPVFVVAQPPKVARARCHQPPFLGAEGSASVMTTSERAAWLGSGSSGGGGASGDALSPNASGAGRGA